MKFIGLFFSIISYIINYIRCNQFISLYNNSELYAYSYDVSMKIYNNEKIIDNMYMNLTNNSKLFLSDVKFSYTGKILYLKEYKKIKILKSKNINYRTKWIFMFDSMKELSIFVNVIKNRNLEYFTNAIIITKTISEEASIYFNYLINLKIFIFYLDNEIFQYIINKYDYDINDNNSNFYARLLSINNKEYNLKHLYILIITSFAILFFCINLFRFSMNTDERNLIFFFIRTIYFFPLIKFVITLLFLMKLKFLQIYNDLYNIGITSIITFLISSLEIFFKSLFIIFSILASKGIDATLRISNRFQFLIFMRKFILIYFILSSTLFNNKYITYFPMLFMFCSIGLEFIVFGYVYKNKKRTTIQLIKKLNLAILYCHEYINSMKIKFEMIKWHWRVNILYFISKIFLNIYNNAFKNYEAEKEIYSHFIDVIAILGYCIIYRPRKWPDNFDVFFKSNFNYFDNLYCCKLNSKDININNNKDKEEKIVLNEKENDEEEKIKLNGSETVKLRNKKDDITEINLKKYYKENKNFPIFVLNPEFFLKNNEKEKTTKRDILINLKNSSIGKYEC